MKRLNNSNYLSTYLIIISITFFLFPALSYSVENTLDLTGSYEPAQLLIQLAGPIGGSFEKQRGGSKDEIVQTGFPEVDALNEQYGVYMAELAWGDDATGSVPESLDNCYVFYFPDEELDMEQIAGEYKEAEGCLEAEPNYIRVGICVVYPGNESKELSGNNIIGMNTFGTIYPNDYYYIGQWPLQHNLYDRDIDAPEAWYYIKYNCNWINYSTKISQLDSKGALHLDSLLRRSWLNISNAQYDFVDNVPDPWWDYPEEYEYHMEPVNGIFLATTNNGPEEDSYIASTNWHSRIPFDPYPYDYFPTYFALIRVLKKAESSEFPGYEDQFLPNIGNIRLCVSGMIRSANKDIDIVLMPYGGYDYSAFEHKAAEWLRDENHDALLIAPAGYLTPWFPTPLQPVMYPANLDEVLSIGATDENDLPTSDTNQYTKIDLWAPGENCISLYYYSNVINANGPAIASAFVTGVAAVEHCLYFQGGGDTAKDLILYSDNVNNLKRLNFYKMIAKTTEEPSYEFNNTTFVEKQEKNITIKLHQNYPNPVIESTTIPVEVNGDTSKNVNIGIYDISGRLVKCFNEVLEPGVNTIIWDSKDDSGSYVKSGVYILKIESEGYSSSLRLVVDR
jgi:hypothetical protein